MIVRKSRFDAGALWKKWLNSFRRARNKSFRIPEEEKKRSAEQVEEQLVISPSSATATSAGSFDDHARQ